MLCSRTSVGFTYCMYVSELKQQVMKIACKILNGNDALSVTYNSLFDVQIGLINNRSCLLSTVEPKHMLCNYVF